MRLTPQLSSQPSPLAREGLKLVSWNGSFPVGVIMAGEDNCYDPTLITSLLNFAYREHIDSFRPDGCYLLKSLRVMVNLSLWSAKNSP